MGDTSLSASFQIASSTWTLIQCELHVKTYFRSELMWCCQKHVCISKRYIKQWFWPGYIYSLCLCCVYYVLIWAPSSLVFPWHLEDVDGAYFGTTFPHLFLMTYGNLLPTQATKTYVPRIFGFKVHKPWCPLSMLHLTTTKRTRKRNPLLSGASALFVFPGYICFKFSR